MTAEEMEKRIVALEAERKQYTDQANVTIGSYLGRVALLRELIIEASQKEGSGKEAPAD